MEGWVNEAGQLAIKRGSVMTNQLCCYSNKACVDHCSLFGEIINSNPSQLQICNGKTLFFDVIKDYRK